MLRRIARTSQLSALDLPCKCLRLMIGIENFQAYAHGPVVKEQEHA